MTWIVSQLSWHLPTTFHFKRITTLLRIKIVVWMKVKCKHILYSGKLFVKTSIIHPEYCLQNDQLEVDTFWAWKIEDPAPKEKGPESISPSIGQSCPHLSWKHFPSQQLVIWEKLFWEEPMILKHTVESRQLKHPHRNRPANGMWKCGFWLTDDITGQK